VTHKRKKEAIRNFLRLHYSDEKLAALLAHARDGKLVYRSCCCILGAATADHALQSGYPRYPVKADHYGVACDLKGANSAEAAYGNLEGNYSGMDDEDADPIRRRILIPMILAEFKRRAAVRQESPSLELVG
jgi:hypothetical protein